MGSVSQTVKYAMSMSLCVLPYAEITRALGAIFVLFSEKVMHASFLNGAALVFSP